MKSFFLLVVILAYSLIPVFSQKVPIKNPSSWTSNNTVNTNWVLQDTAIASSYFYLLVDHQTHIPLETSFRKHAVKILNNEGVQKQSDIAINFDPNYQKLTFHQLLVIRDGKEINKLLDHEIRTYNVERRGERYLYDGSVEAVVNLMDIRVGDIIIYSYSIKGFNPAYYGHFSSTLDFQYNSPVLELRKRLISNPQRKLKIKYFPQKWKPEITQKKSEIEYLWVEKNTNAIIFDKNVPGWYDPSNRITISDYESWSEVIKDLYPLYNIDKTQLDKIKSEFSSEVKIDINDYENIVNKAIRFVQDEVRYLGFENGINAFKPHSPLQVFNQRFGDCKDKSVLLCSILNAFGIQSSPVLVNTYLKEYTESELPGLGNFNHCVVQVELENNVFYIDPTINFQGGELSKIYFPYYGKGLVIKKETKGLIDLPKAEEKGTRVYQKLIIPNEFDSITLQIKTIYHDSRADDLRSYFANNSLEEISKNYVNFYNAEYSGLRRLGNIKYYDKRDEGNQFIVDEEYLMPNFGSQSLEEKNTIKYNFYPIDFEDYLYVPKSPSRTMPYSTPFRTPYFLNMKICFPKYVEGYIGRKSFENEAYKYHYESRMKGDTISITHQYETLKDFISAEKVEAYLNAHQKMKDYLYYKVKYNTINKPEFVFSWNILYSLIGFILLGGILCRKIYFSFDISPKFELRRDQPIGGALFIVGFFLMLKPFYWLISLLENGSYLNSNLWEYVMESENSSFNLPLIFMLCIQLIYEAFQFSFLVFLIVIFFQKRTIFPRLTIIYLGINMVYTLAIAFMFAMFGNEVFDFGPSAQLITYTFLISILGFFYFNRSGRVDQTFIYSTKRSFLD